MGCAASKAPSPPRSTGGGQPGKVQTPNDLTATTSTLPGCAAQAAVIDQRATAEQSDKTAEQRRASHSAESVPAPTLLCKAAGLTHIGYGPLKSENQDTILVREEAFTDRMGRHSVFGVFDGHGAWGKPIAHQSSQLLPYFVDVGLRHKPKGGGEAFEQPWPDQISTVLTAAFLATEDEICEKNDARGSGTTASVVYIKGDQLWVASVGDSRVALVQQSDADGGYGSEDECYSGMHAKFSSHSSSPLQDPFCPSGKNALSDSSPAKCWLGSATMQRQESAAALGSTDMSGPDAVRPEFSRPATPAATILVPMMAVDAVADLEDGPTEQVDDIYTTQDAILSTTECVQAPEPDGDRSCSVLSSTCSSGSMQIKRSAGFRTIPLTNDHRAGCAIECERLLRAGARVHPKRLPGGLEIGEPRMWLQHRDSPGLLLSRAIGDQVASSIGCIAYPEVVHRQLQPGRDMTLIIASDGVWDVLSTEEVGKLVMRASSPRAAAKAVLRRALRGWRALRAADNLSIVVVQLSWQPAAAPPSSHCPSPASSSPSLPSPPSWPSSSPSPPATPLQAPRELPIPRQGSSASLLRPPAKNSWHRAAKPITPDAILGMRTDSSAVLQQGVRVACNGVVPHDDPESWQKLSPRQPGAVHSSAGPGKFSFLEYET